MNVDECSSNPCLNGGACVDGVASYECQCGSGFEGLDCETKVNFCRNNPCRNGGRCNEGVEKFSCTCPKGEWVLRGIKSLFIIFQSSIATSVIQF